MAVLKYKDPVTSTWVPIVRGPQGIQGIQGPVGPEGPMGPVGVGLDEVTADNKYVNKDGPASMTGPLTLNPTSTQSSSPIDFSVNLPYTHPIWRLVRLGPPVPPETGVSAGYDFAVTCWDNDGTPLGNALHIKRSTQQVTVKADPIDNLGVATKQYVDVQGKSASGVVTGIASIAAGGVLAVSITFPVGRFIATPNLVAMANSGRILCNLTSVNTTGASVTLNNITASASPAGIQLQWIAHSI